MELRVGGLETQEVAVGPGSPQSIVCRPTQDARAQGDGRIRAVPADELHGAGQGSFREFAILAPLEHEGPQPGAIAFSRDGRDLLGFEPVAGDLEAGSADAAIEAIAGAAVGVLYEAAKENGPAVPLDAELARSRSQGLGIGSFIEGDYFLAKAFLGRHVNRRQRIPPLTRRERIRPVCRGACPGWR